MQVDKDKERLIEIAKNSLQEWEGWVESECAGTSYYSKDMAEIKSLKHEVMMVELAYYAPTKAYCHICGVCKAKGCEHYQKGAR